MKKEKHPPYQKVLFIDTSTGEKYLIGTTLQSKEKQLFEGQEYPVCHVAISSSSHPIFVGGKQFVDTEGRVDKFTKRYQAVAQKAEAAHAAELAEKEEKKAKKSPTKAKKPAVRKTKVEEIA
jgi:large subunit ribosomal protein L31